MNEDNLNLALLNNDLWNENLMLKKENDELRRMNNALSVVGREKSPILGMYQHRQLLMHLYPWLCGSKNEQHWYSMHELWNP